MTEIVNMTTKLSLSEPSVNAAQVLRCRLAPDDLGGLI
jgi:hypothetical protein